MISRTTWLLLAFSSAPFIAHAESGSAVSATQLDQSSIETEEEEPPNVEVGRVLILVFRDGLPASDVRLKVAGNNVKPDTRGVAKLELAQGRYLVEPEGYGGSTSFQVIGGEETEVILNLLPPDRLEGEESAPKAAANGKKLSELAGPLVRIELVSEADGKPIAGANVLLAGVAGVATSNEQGVVELRLPPGEHSISVLHKNFATKIFPETVSADGKLTTGGRYALKPADTELEEYVVLAPKVKGSVAALVEVRRNSSAVADVLGADQMARQGDSDAAASLRRVTGLTLVGGKYVYVRGLGERYSAVTLNGSSLPSPEPSRRVVPLDLFPTSVLESVVVQKSFTPELPAEFGGGLIQLKTRSLPEQPFVKAGVSLGFQEDRGALTYQGGSKDWLGMDDGTRAMPSAIRDVLAGGRQLNVNNPPAFTGGVSQDELRNLGRSLRNVYSVTPGKQSPPPSASLAAGTRIGGPSFSVGAAASGLYTSSADSGMRISKTYNVPSGKQLEEDESAEIRRSDREVKTSGTLDLGIEANKRHKVETHLLLARDTSNETQVKEFSRKSDSRFRRKTTTLEWVERQLLTTQVTGSHQFSAGEEKAVEWSWRASRSTARRDAPDTREYSYEQKNQGDPWALTLDATGNRRTWSELEDLTKEVGTELVVPFGLGALGQAKARLGASYLTRTRVSDTWRLHFKSLNPGQIDPTRPPEELFPTDDFQLTNLTETADSMTGEQEISAVHAGVEWEPTPRWTLTAGARQENGTQVVKTFYYFSRNKPETSAGLETKNLLPSYSLTWKPNPSWRARLAYSETVARPEFRELSTVPFIDDETGYETFGNAGLKGTVIRNYDHRWEFYPSPEEAFSVGVFLKEFDSPIEETFEPSPNLRKTFQNAASARNIGAEFEGRFDLRNLARFLRRWTFIGNLSLVRSQIELDTTMGGVQTSKDRPLQGQSPWIVNLQLQYDRPAQGRSFSFLYNAVGPRITEVGTMQRPDVYEQPFHQLDFVASQRIYRKWNAGFKAKNLLDPEATSTQGEKIVRTYRKGRSFNVSLATNF